jgi:hypothetical protein
MYGVWVGPVAWAMHAPPRIGARGRTNSRRDAIFQDFMSAAFHDGNGRCFHPLWQNPGAAFALSRRIRLHVDFFGGYPDDLNR